MGTAFVLRSLSMRVYTKTALLVVALGIGVDLLSFIGWSAPSFEAPIALVLLAVVAAGAMADIRWGVAVVLIELLWGSHGHLLHLSFAGAEWSLRMGIFAVVLAAAIWHLRNGAARQFVVRAVRTHPARWPALVFSATLAVAAILGALRHPWDRVFFDANAWAFILLAPAFLLAWREEHHRPWLVTAFLTGAAYLIVRTYVLFFLFTHDLGGLWVPLYQWVRDTRLGEVTVFPGGFPRVFLPSAVYFLAAIPLAAHARSHPRLRWIVIGGGVAVLTVGLSRSYWIGLLTIAAAGVIAGFVRTRRHAFPWRAVWHGAAAIAIGFAVAIALVRFPYPPRLTTAGFGETIVARFQQDAAVGNRWQQIAPLYAAIRSHPIFGSGFGAAVTYETRDPRTRATHPNGEYTTTAFEWGYFDDLLERGFLGLLAELWLIATLVWYGLKTSSPHHASLSLGLLAIAVVHATSPYLNHPLGIGMLLIVFAAVARRDAQSSTHSIAESYSAKVV